MSLVNGVPNPKFVIDAGLLTEESFVMQGFLFTEKYTPDFLSHEMQDAELKRKLRGFRYRSELHWEGVPGSELWKLSRLLHQVTVGSEPGYSTVWYYPYSTDKPNHYIDVTIDDDDIDLQFEHLLAMKDFTLKLIGRYRTDFVPIGKPDVIRWGTIAVCFDDIASTTFDQYTT